jgi:hypothetical protein
VRDRVSEHWEWDQSNRGRGIGRITLIPTNVDNYGDAKASEFLTVPQAATGKPYLLETEALENRQLPADAENCLGHIGSPDDILWNFSFCFNDLAVLMAPDLCILLDVYSYIHKPPSTESKPRPRRQRAMSVEAGWPGSGSAGNALQRACEGQLPA